MNWFWRGFDAATRPLVKLDGFLVLNVFMRISHWADWRWHINQYRLASHCAAVAAILCAVGWTDTALRSPWPLRIVLVLALAGMMFFIQDFRGSLHKASDQWERDPMNFPRAGIVFVILFPGIRLVYLITGLLLIAPRSFEHTPGMIGDMWMLVYSWAWYFAAGLPPIGKARRKKKERAPLLAPAPSAVPGRLG